MRIRDNENIGNIWTDLTGVEDRVFLIALLTQIRNDLEPARRQHFPSQSIRTDYMLRVTLYQEYLTKVTEAAFSALPNLPEAENRRAIAREIVARIMNHVTTKALQAEHIKDVVLKEIHSQISGQIAEQASAIEAAMETAAQDVERLLKHE